MTNQLTLQTDKQALPSIHVNGIENAKLKWDFSHLIENNSEEMLLFETGVLGIADYSVIYNLTTTARKVSCLFRNNNLSGILTLLPSLREYHILPSSIRIIVTLSLLILGRISGALREFSLLLEMEHDPEHRERYIQCLDSFFQHLKMPQIDLEEIIDITKGNETAISISKVDKVILMILEQKTRKYSLTHEECISIIPKTHLIYMETINLEEQAQLYLANGGKLDDYSFGRLCISTRREIDNVLAILHNWDGNGLINGVRNPIQLIVNEIIKLAPLYLYLKLKRNKDLILSYMAHEFQSTRGIGSNTDIEKIAISLEDYSSLFPGNAILNYVMVVNHRVTLGYLKYLDQDYFDAITHFEWVLAFFHLRIQKLGSASENRTSLSSVTKKVIMVLLARCYEYGGIPCDNKRLNELFLSFHKATQENTISEFLSGRLSMYYLSLGLLHEFEGVNEASKVVLENNRHEIISIAFRLQQKNLEEMVNKYILAATSKALDDPRVNFLYDRIIWGIIFIGGIHLKTLLFFILVKNYFLIEADIGPLHIFQDLGIRTFANDDILGQYKNSWELIDKIESIYNSISMSDKNIIWEERNGGKYLIPQIFDAGDRLLITELYYDDHDNNHLSTFILGSHNQVRQKAKRQNKLAKELISNRIKVSQDFIKLWYKSYKECHGSIPTVLVNFLTEE